MSDIISREAARLIALEYISDSMERHGALEAIRALPAVQPDKINWRDDPDAIVEDDEPQIGRDYE